MPRGVTDAQRLAPILDNSFCIPHDATMTRHKSSFLPYTHLLASDSCQLSSDSPSHHAPTNPMMGYDHTMLQPSPPSSYSCRLTSDSTCSHKHPKIRITPQRALCHIQAAGSSIRRHHARATHRGATSHDSMLPTMTIPVYHNGGTPMVWNDSFHTTSKRRILDPAGRSASKFPPGWHLHAAPRPKAICLPVGDPTHRNCKN